MPIYMIVMIALFVLFLIYAAYKCGDSIEKGENKISKLEAIISFRNAEIAEKDDHIKRLMSTVKKQTRDIVGYEGRLNEYISLHRKNNKCGTPKRQGKLSTKPPSVV